MIDSDSTPGRFSSDSHANTCVLGKGWTLWEGTGEVCCVLGFSDQLDAIQGIEMVTGATAWDDPNTGRTYVLMACNGSASPWTSVPYARLVSEVRQRASVLVTA